MHTNGKLDGSVYYGKSVDIHIDWNGLFNQINITDTHTYAY